MLKKIDFRFIKFLLVGALNTAFGYGIYSLFLFLNFHYAQACLFSTILGILFNYKTTGVLVFKNDDNSLIFKFFGVYVITYLLNIAFLKVFAMINFNMYYAGLILVLPMALVSYTLMKNFVFNTKIKDIADEKN